MMEPKQQQQQPEGKDRHQKLKREDNLPWAWINAVRDELSTGPFEDRELPAQVLPWLYIADLTALFNASDLLDRGISHVLTTNKMYSAAELKKLKKRLSDAGIQQLVVSGQDYHGYDMIGNHWNDCRTFLEEVRNKGNAKVTVHCAGGHNRSGLIVAAALVCIEQMALLDAIKVLKERRGMVLMNRSFQKQICVLAMTEGLLGEKPKGYNDTERVIMVENKRDRWL
jgi:protein-tyrosine phosphatase